MAEPTYQSARHLPAGSGAGHTLGEMPASNASGASVVVFVPTDLELARLVDAGGLGQAASAVHVCGFGPIASAARVAQILAQQPFERALLLGIAGTFDEQAAGVGSAVEFSSAAVEGVGVGQGLNLRAPPALGFPQWPGSQEPCTDPIYDRLQLAHRRVAAPRLLVTTCAASADAEQAALRRIRFQDAVAEDMEGFAVALACALAEVPLRIVRGISNRVGDRDPSHWSIPRAIEAARQLALGVLQEPDAWLSADQWRASNALPVKAP